ncbi:MAG TPA: hypothetical protein VJ417_03645 [Candidatus Glassbacteria bacterium]|nr:hypothetical protein [Candidatus Glassbacteria bacterium]
MLPSKKHLLVAVTLAVAVSVSCSDNGGSVTPPDDSGALTQEHWWDNYLDATGNPITLSSGFKLSALTAQQKSATRWSSTSVGFVLNFVIDPNWRTNIGWLFRGADQGNGSLENLAGAVEIYKDAGWLKNRENFDWEGMSEDPPGSFNFKRVNRFAQFSIRTPFAGVVVDLMLSLLAEPYIAIPTDTTKTWQGDPVHVSQGPGSEFLEVINYRLRYVGQAGLEENGKRIASFQDVIAITGTANQGQGYVEAYLAPNVGLVYYYLLTAFGQKAAGALLGYSGENLSISGESLNDYFPTAGGNHWIYEFAPDNRVDQFRFKVVAF